MKADEFYQIVFAKFKSLTDQLSKLHEEIHKNDLDIAEIKQWKKDQDEFEAANTAKEATTQSQKQWGWEKMFGIGGILFGIVAILLTFI